MEVLLCSLLCLFCITAMDITSVDTEQDSNDTELHPTTNTRD